jgi:MoaA/NifB/PqqE/SkfB family radical SAM enzyme
VERFSYDADIYGEVMQDWSKASWVDPSLNWTPLPVPELPGRVLMDLATKCNLRCPMCPVWGSEDEAAIDAVTGTMDLEASRRLLDEIMSAKPLIQPNMYGEPLLAPNLRDQIMDMKSRGMAVAMNTNGLTLNESLAQFFVDQKVDSVMFSIDAVSRGTLKKIRGIDKIEKIETAVFRLLKMRGGADFPRVGVSFTIQGDNRHEVEAFVARWVGVVDVVRMGILFENGTFPDMETPLERLPCPAIYNTLPAHNDGVVTVCCLDGFKTTNMGNVFKDGAKAVWQGEEFAKTRYYHETRQWDKVPFCKPCNGWAQYEFAEEVRDGLLIRKSPQYSYYNKIAKLKNWQGNLLGGHPAPPQELVEALA